MSRAADWSPDGLLLFSSQQILQINPFHCIVDRHDAAAWIRRRLSIVLSRCTDFPTSFCVPDGLPDDKTKLPTRNAVQYYHLNGAFA